MIYMSIDKRYPYMTMLCELIDKYFVKTLLCSGGVKWVLEVYIGGRSGWFYLITLLLLVYQ